MERREERRTSLRVCRYPDFAQEGVCVNGEASIPMKTERASVAQPLQEESNDERRPPPAGSSLTRGTGDLSLRDELVDKVWEEFVRDFLLASRHIQKAAIFDLATRRPLAGSGDLDIRPEELEQLIACLHSIRLAYRDGVSLNGRRYQVRLADGRHGLLARSQGEGLTVCKTHSLLLVGFHDQRGNFRQCNEDVMRLGDFLRRKAV